MGILIAVLAGISTGIFVIIWTIIQINDTAWKLHCDQTDTTLTFERFKVLYNADPEHWDLWDYDKIVNPIYRFNDDKFIVKMATKQDYQRFKEWLVEVEEEGYAPGQVRRSKELTDIISGMVKERAEKAQQELDAFTKQVASTEGLVLRTGDVAVVIGNKDKRER